MSTATETAAGRLRKVVGQRQVAFAGRAIEEHSRLALSVPDSEAFVDALLNPRPANDRLRDTVRRYRERAGVAEGTHLE